MRGKMSSNKEFAAYMMEQLEPLVDIRSRAMMGGYIFYYRGKIIGGIYEPGFMLKITPASKKYFADARIMPPYQGAKDMILVDDVDNQDLLYRAVSSMFDELPMPTAKKKGKK
jgi:TfoX/Sxy family transcriptional regulator of competence genes